MAERGAINIGCAHALPKDRYTLIEQSFNFIITCMQYSQKNFMRIIGNDQKNNGQNFWEILERIIGKISSVIGTGLSKSTFNDVSKIINYVKLEQYCIAQKFGRVVD